MSVSNILSGIRLTIDEADGDFRVANNLIVGNTIINQNLLDRITAIETEIASIKTQLSSIGSSEDLGEIKQIIANILETLNPQ